jgi:hypothetical protein
MAIIAIAEAPGHCDGRAVVFSVHPDTEDGLRAAYGELKRDGGSTAAYRCQAEVGDRIPLHREDLYPRLDLGGELQRHRTERDAAWQRGQEATWAAEEERALERGGRRALRELLSERRSKGMSDEPYGWRR